MSEERPAVKGTIRWPDGSTERFDTSKDKLLEKIARRMAARYGDPDELIIAGEPQRVALPGCLGYFPDLQRARPLWTAYILLAKTALDVSEGGDVTA
jgi:hypothetical protein